MATHVPTLRPQGWQSTPGVAFFKKASERWSGATHLPRPAGHRARRTCHSPGLVMSSKQAPGGRDPCISLSLPSSGYLSAPVPPDLSLRSDPSLWVLQASSCSDSAPYGRRGLSGSWARAVVGGRSNPDQGSSPAWAQREWAFSLVGPYYPPDPGNTHAGSPAS